MKKKLRLLCLMGCFLALLSESAVACRLWAALSQRGHTLSGSDFDNSALIGEELAALYNEGAGQPNGWALGYYRDNQIIEGRTLVRSPIPSTSDSLHFFSAAAAILDPSHGTTLAMGHLRTASSGAVPIPDPHPFLFTYGDACYSFVLNGTFDREPFMQLLTKGGKDSSWLLQHPPHTYGNGDWRGAGFSSIVATELYLSWIVKNIVESGDVLSGLSAALVRVFEVIPSACSRNIIFSDGQRLYVSGGSGCLKYSCAPSTVVYANRTYVVAHQAVMTEPPTTGAAGAMAWTTVLDNQLVALTPDTTEIYSYDALKAIAIRNTITVKGAYYYDNDADGYIDSIYVTADRAVTPGRIREIGDSCLFVLPRQRKFGVRKYIPIDSVSFAITVVQNDQQSPPITSVLPYDMLSAHAHRFEVGGRLMAADTVIHDHIAPVIVSAKVRRGVTDSSEAAPDTLIVKFSEPIAFSGHGSSLRPFNFLRHRLSDSKEFSPTFSLRAAAMPSDSLSFIVVDCNHPSIDRLMENDSLWISTSADLIGDTVNPPNVQRNAGNIRRALALDSSKGIPRVPFDPYPAISGNFRARAQTSGTARLTVYSLAGRCISQSTLSVQKNQWISLRLTDGGNQRALAQGIALFSLSLGNMQRRGFMYAGQSRQLEVRVGN